VVVAHTREDRARRVSEATNFPTREPRMPMRRDHFLDFHRAAESAGYPALLIVSMVSLGAVVAPLVLLALTGAGWLLGVTLLGLIAAIALLAGEFNAAVSDGDQPPWSVRRGRRS
jgi:Na+/H+-translocating membrane pyrophosphatase